MTRENVPNRHVNPLLVTLPDWVHTIKPHQVRAIREILEGFESSQLVFLDAPTGTGKTLIAECVRRMLRARAIYCCTTKSLQAQFLRDYPYARVCMGRANYPTELLADEFPEVTTEDCTPGTCSLCSDAEECPYNIAKFEAASADVAVLNVAYLLSETRGEKSMFRKRPLMVMDEADTLEQELMRFISLEVSERRMRRFGWQHPEKVTVASSWAEWLNYHIADLYEHRKAHRQKLNREELSWQRENRYLHRLQFEMRGVLEEVENGNWVYTGAADKGPVAFRPVRVDQKGAMLWGITEGKWLLMSATPISVEERLDALGWEGSYKVVRVPSTFPLENRRVRYVPVANMNAKQKTESMQPMAQAVRTICDRHPNDRVLVHTHSYENTRILQRFIQRDGFSYPKVWDRSVLTYEKARDREPVLAEFKSSRSAVLLAPSMDRGVDLPDDLCRVVIITKVPYPYMGDRQVSARLHSHGGRTWYLCETTRTIVQMCGRAVRNVDDWCETWVLDGDFDQFFQRARSLMPKWWADAIVWKPETL